MAGNLGRHARRTAARAVHRKAVVAEKRRQERQEAGGALVAQVRRAATQPIHGCMICGDLAEDGMASLVMARSLPSGAIGMACFLVDAFCLGIKDAFYEELTRPRLEALLDTLSLSDPFRDMDPACARKLIGEASAYGARLGFSPPANLRAIEAIFGDIDAGACMEIFTFGRDGKPLYIPGPTDTSARIRSVIATLERAVGPDGYEVAGPFA